MLTTVSQACFNALCKNHVCDCYRGNLLHLAVPYFGGSVLITVLDPSISRLAPASRAKKHRKRARFICRPPVDIGWPLEVKSGRYCALTWPVCCYLCPLLIWRHYHRIIGSGAVCPVINFWKLPNKSDPEMAKLHLGLWHNPGKKVQLFSIIPVTTWFTETLVALQKCAKTRSHC